MRDASCELRAVTCELVALDMARNFDTLKQRLKGTESVRSSGTGIGSLGGCLLLVVFVADCTPRYRQIVPLSPSEAAAAAAVVGSHYGKLIFALAKHNKAESGHRCCFQSVVSGLPTHY